MSLSDEDSFAIIGTPSLTKTLPTLSQDNQNVNTAIQSLIVRSRAESDPIPAPAGKVIDPGNRSTVGSSWEHLEDLGSSVRFDPCLTFINPTMNHHSSEELKGAPWGKTPPKTPEEGGANGEQNHYEANSNIISSFDEMFPHQSSHYSLTSNEESVEEQPQVYSCECLAQSSNSRLSKQLSIDPEVQVHLSEKQDQEKTCTVNLWQSIRALSALATLTGLWNPGRGFRVIFPLVILLVSLYVLVGFVFTTWICFHSNSTLGAVYCPKKQVPNVTAPEVPNKVINYLGQFFEVELCCIQVVTYLILLGCLCRLKRAVDTFSFLQYPQCLTKSDCVALNIQIIVVFAVLIFANFDPTQSESIAEGYKPSVYTIFLMYPGPNLTWICLVSGCWVFAVIACALANIIEKCLTAIRDLKSGTLDDVIDIHEHLCGHVLGTVGVLKYWFIVHWFSFAFLTVIGISLLLVKLQDLASRQYSIGSLALVLYTFLCPCLYATRVTSQSKQIAMELNCSRARDWSEGHPLRRRENLSLFLEYVDRAQCGFKIAGITINSSVTWVSMLIAVCGMTIWLIAA
ncbi:predicted protein [Nematostella vectensis]|uniref:Uncharacterized protein n=1 Tax=Nematostella vectensis TaxID=45351 RepID=A7REZ4_NEMVE|nr:predicted protein [Nematostella vectensis]|eukprot:XP_001641942.1 predicted protein [Nematostella vectensis]